MVEDRISRTLLRERVLGTITTAILDGTLQPGERLRDDELTAWLGTSRAPIREALDQLADIGLVEMAPNRFTKVAVISPRLYAESAAVWSAMVTRGVYWGILAFPAGRLAELEAINAELDGAIPAHFPPGPTPVDRFVAAVLEHCDNRVLLESIRAHDPLLALGVNRFKDSMDARPIHAFFEGVIRRCRDHDVQGFESDMRVFLGGPMTSFMARVSGFDDPDEYEEARDAGTLR